MTQVEMRVEHQPPIQVAIARDVERQVQVQEVPEDEIAVQAELLRALARPLPLAQPLELLGVKVIGSPARVGPGGWRNGRR